MAELDVLGPPKLAKATPVRRPIASEDTMPLAEVPTYVWNIRVIRGQIVGIRGRGRGRGRRGLFLPVDLSPLSCRCASVALGLLLFDVCCVGG